MTREIQSQLLGEFYAEKKNILKLKGEDYANEDVLSNFKTAGANIGISAEQQCLSLIATKVARLGNLLAGKTPNNESISDSILDLSNYTDLLYCLVNEENANVPNEEPQTKRWENVKPKQKSILKEMMAQDEKDGLYNIMKPLESNGQKFIYSTEDFINDMEDVFGKQIKEPYEPKVGDVLIYNTLVYKWEIVYLDDNTVYLNAMGDLLITQRISRELFLEYIKESVLKKIN